VESPQRAFPSEISVVEGIRMPDSFMCECGSRFSSVKRGKKFFFVFLNLAGGESKSCVFYVLCFGRRGVTSAFC
jgi:hypothetical protein